MLCKVFYKEDVHEILLWILFGTTKNIILCEIISWEIMLGGVLL